MERASVPQFTHMPLWNRRECKKGVLRIGTQNDPMELDELSRNSPDTLLILPFKRITFELCSHSSESEAPKSGLFQFEINAIIPRNRRAICAISSIALFSASDESKPEQI